MIQSHLVEPTTAVFTQFTDNLRTDLGLNADDWSNERILFYTISPLLLDLHRAKHLGRLHADTSEQRFEEFQTDSGTHDFLEGFKRDNKDIIDRILADNNRDLAFTRSAAAALSRDWSALFEHGYVPTVEPARPIEVTAMGDWHDQEPAARLTAAGVRLFRKGHPSANAAMMTSVWAAIMDGSDDSLLPLTWEESFRSGGYTWSKEVSRLPLTSPEEASAYYARLGQLLFLAYLLQTSDLHYENIIPHGDCPVLVDSETVGSVRLLPTRAPTAAALHIVDRLADSVLLTGMLPLGVADSGAPDVSAIAANELRREIRVLKDVATDNMRFERRMNITKVTDHLPFTRAQSNGKETRIRYDHYVPSLLTGFREAYNAYLRSTDGVAAAVSQWAEACVTRVLARNTSEYVAVRQALGSQRFKGRADDVLDHLRRSNTALAGPLIDSECESLRAGLIPSFRCDLTSRNVVDESGRTVCVLDSSPYNTVLDHMAGLSAADRDLQMNIITFALVGAQQMQAHRWSDPSRRAKAIRPARTSPVATAIDTLREQIGDATVTGPDDSVSWESVTVDDRDNLVISPLSDGIYNGIQGVQYALGQDVTPVSPQILAQDASRSVYLGPSSPLLTQHSPDIDPRESVKDDSVYDVIGGSAGIILSWRHARDLAEIDVIDALAQHLVDSRDTSADVLQWPLERKNRLNNASFAHGNAGIGTALLVAGVTTGRREYVEVGLAALQTDERLRTADGMWQDLRIEEAPASSSHWCHGATGLAVARITALELDKRTGGDLLPATVRERFTDDLRRVADYLITAIHDTESFSLCHGVAGSLLTLDYLDRTSAVSGYHARIAQAFAEVAAFGLGGDWRCGTDTHQSYALMTGLAGVLHALHVHAGPRPTLEPLLPITPEGMTS